MKRRLLYALVLLGMLAVPTEGIDVGRLLPVEVIHVYKAGDLVRLQTDTGNTGVGMDFETAYRALKHQASAEVFLDTADYVILTGEAANLKEEMLKYLDPGIRVCAGEGDLDVEAVAAYLSIHRPDMSLAELGTQRECPVLTQTEAGFDISKNRKLGLDKS